ncbi:MAG: glycine cleavage system protein GcvH [Planctomycetes bacterium]|nr:glycine cleavage system protein GcvH [Planctomycetota bacterium]
MTSPSNLKYTKSHEWAQIQERAATVGITEHAVSQLTDLTFVDLPRVGDKVAAGSRFGEIESVKAVADLNSPLSGKVIEVNTALASDSGLENLSEDPYGRGWMIKIELSNPAEAASLLSNAQYDQYIAGSEH